MLREARVLSALQGRARVPRVLAVCDDASVLGVPFYVMEELNGHVVTDALPAMLDSPGARARRAGTTSSMRSSSCTRSTSRPRA